MQAGIHHHDIVEPDAAFGDEPAGVLAAGGEPGPHEELHQRDAALRDLGLGQRQRRQILAGAVVAHAVMSELGVERLRVCPWALREGIMLRHLEANASGSVDLPLQPLVRLTDRPDATVTPLHQ